MQNNITVEGMMCAMCENKVVKNIKALKGVKKVEASSANKLVSVTYNEKKITLDEIKSAISDLGYEVK